MKACKGFDKDMKCRGFQYESGKEYEWVEAKLCHSGSHACENPLDTFRYYRPGESRARGKLGTYIVVSEHDDDGNIIDAKIVRVDGEAVKENTWYTLRNGEISEVEE